MQPTPPPAQRSGLRWFVAAGVFAAGAIAGWLAGQRTTDAPPREAAVPRSDVVSRDAGVAASANDAARARRAGGDGGRNEVPPRQRGTGAPGPRARPAFPDLRWREPSSAPLPPPPADGSAAAQAPPASEAPPPAVSVERALALLAEASRDTDPPDAAQANAVVCAAVLVANATPLPAVPVDVFRGLAARFPDQDVGGILLPCVPVADVATELTTLLAGGGNWGTERQRDLWIVRFADVVADHGGLPAGTIDRLLAWPRPWVRATAIGRALDEQVIDRARLEQILERDADVDVRIAAFRHYLESAREGEESETIAVVRRVLRSGGPEGDVAIEALPGLGSAAVPLAREVVAEGGLTGGEMRSVAETLLRGGSADDLLGVAASGRFNDELLDAVEDLVLEAPDRLASLNPLVRALPAPRVASDAEDHFQRIANLGLRQILVDTAATTAADPVVRAAALTRLWDDEERRAETAGLVAAALADPNPDVRRLVVDELGADFAETSPEHLSTLRAIAASDPSAAVRRAATEALGDAE